MEHFEEKMKHKLPLILSIIFSSITIILVLICFAIYSLFLGPANPKLHKIKIGEEQKLTSVYKCKCEKIVFIQGKDQNEKKHLFCDSIDEKGFCDVFDVMILFVNKSKNAVAYPLHVYFDDLEREPFYDGIEIDIPFEKELNSENAVVKRLSKNTFCIKEK